MLSFNELENITGIEQDRDANNDEDVLFIEACNQFWQKLPESDRKNIYQWLQAEAGNINLCEDDKHSLLMEIVCELSDTALVSEYGIPLDDMTDEDGSFYEKYQDRFNDLYDEIEERLLTMNK